MGDVVERPYKEWTPVQRAYVEERIRGKSMKKAAEAAGCHVNSGQKWELDERLRMREAIEAGRKLIDSVGDEEKAEQTMSAMRSLIREVTIVSLLPPMIARLEERQAGLGAIDTLCDIMYNSKSDETRRRAALDVLRLMGTEQAIKTKMMESTEEIVTKSHGGFTPEGRKYAEEAYLIPPDVEQRRLELRAKAWDAIAVPGSAASTEEEEVGE